MPRNWEKEIQRKIISEMDGLAGLHLAFPISIRSAALRVSGEDGTNQSRLDPTALVSVSHRTCQRWYDHWLDFLELPGSNIYFWRAPRVVLTKVPVKLVPEETIMAHLLRVGTGDPRRNLLLEKIQGYDIYFRYQVKNGDVVGIPLIAMSQIFRSKFSWNLLLNTLRRSTFSAREVTTAATSTSTST